MNLNNLPTAKNPAALAGAVVGLGLASVIIRQAALLFPDGPLIRLTLTTAGYLAGVGLLLALAWLAWSLVVKAARSLIQVESTPAPAEVRQASTELDTLSSILSNLEEVDGAEANRRIQDACTATEHILAAATAVAKRSEDFAHRRGILSEAIEVISAEDRKGMACLAGRVTWDQGISQALLADVAWTNDAYWTSIIKLISSQVGVCQEWGRIYEQYSAALVGKVASEKARVAGLLAASEFIEASRQLIVIERDLEQARSSLSLHQPGVRYRLTSTAPGVKLLGS